jgi:hypothetical protein
MDKRVEKILEIWHKYFVDEEKQYSEFESSDIEYFVGCMLYNHFAFSKALDTMKTIDLSYDFISACGSEYDEITYIVKSINFDEEEQKLKFLQDYISEAKSKYRDSELYLLNRLEYHVNGMALRYEKNVNAKRVDFQNPLYR